jgi:hypothetical protein
MNLEKYTFPTKNGKLLSTELFPNGNMLRYTAEYLFLTKKYQDNKDWSLILGIRDCESPNQIGAFSRHSNRMEDTQVDDYLVLGTISYLATQILFGAKCNWGCLSVDREWSFKQFMPRYMGMWQHLRISAGESVGLIGQAIWALSLYLAARKPITNQDNWVLSHLMVLTYERKNLNSWICNKAVQYWKSKKTKETWQIMSEYLGPNCQDHPLIDAWRSYK